MGVSQRGLADGEDVVYRSRPHWMALGWPLVWVVGLAITAVALLVGEPGAPVQVGYALAVAGVIALLWLAGRTLRWATTTLCVTTLRLVERAGVLSRRGTEIRLDRIAELSYRQSLPALVFGGGSLVVDTGAGGLATFDHVRRPARVQSLITEQISERWRTMTARTGDVDGASGRRGGGWWTPDDSHGDRVTPPAGVAAVGTANPGAGGPSPADRLATLVELHRRGLVNDGEFAVKRAEIIRQL